MRLLTRVSVLAGAALALGAVALFPSLALADGPPGSGGPFVGPLHAVSTIALHGAGATATSTPTASRSCPAATGTLSRATSDQQLQRQRQPAGHRHDDRRGGARPARSAVRADRRRRRCPGPCPGGVGLTTALSVLPGGCVVVGSLPTSDGSSATAQAGCLLVLNSHGQVGRDVGRQGDQRALGHDRASTFGAIAVAVRHQRAQRHRGRRTATSVRPAARSLRIDLRTVRATDRSRDPRATR